MAVQAAHEFQAYMESKDMHVRIPEDDENVALMQFNLDGTNIRLFISFSEDSRVVNIEGRNFVSIPADKHDLVYKLCNECNYNYRWIKFIWDEKHEEVSSLVDAIIDADTGAEECYELVMRTCSIVQSCYPLFMKAIWA